MTGPTGNSELYFTSTSMFPLALPQETLRVSGKQNSLFPLGQVIKCLLFLLFLVIINILNTQIANISIENLTINIPSVTFFYYLRALPQS